MKILLAVNATSPTKPIDNALRWAGRLGLDLKLFVPKGKRTKFFNTIDEVNYHYYQGLTYDCIVNRTDAENYARQHEYDLLLQVPEDLHSWRKGMQFNDAEIFLARTAIGKARLEFAEKPRKRIKKWFNGVTMERVEKQ